MKTSIVAGVIALMTVSPVLAEEDTLEQAIAQFYTGEWEQSIGVMNKLLEDENMELREQSRARKFVALGYILLGRPDEAVEVYKQIVRDDPAFDMDALTIQGGETPDEAVRYFGQALLEVRQEEMRAREAQLSRTSRKGAILRSVVLPGWGQRYQGYKGRSYVMLGVTAVAAIYAVTEESSYQTAKDDYDKARPGADFEDLHDEYSRQSDQADVALGILGAAWMFNVMDTLFQGPNITRPSDGLSFKSTMDGFGFRLTKSF